MAHFYDSKTVPFMPFSFGKFAKDFLLDVVVFEAGFKTNNCFVYFVIIIFVVLIKNECFAQNSKPTDQRWPFPTVLNFSLFFFNNLHQCHFCSVFPPNVRGGVAWAEEHRCTLGNAVSEECTVTDVALWLFLWRNEENGGCLLLQMLCFCFLCHNAFWVM